MEKLIKGGFAGLAVLVILAGFSTGLWAQQAAPQGRTSQAIERNFQPYITVQEVYDSNIFLRPPEFKKEDWITTVAPGIRFNRQDAFFGLNMDVNGGYNWYARNDDLNYWSALGNVEGRYSPNRYWNFLVREYIIRSEDPRETQYGGYYNQNYTGVNQERSIYVRNVVTPSIEYLFARDSSLRVAYINNYYANKDPQTQDSMSHAVNPVLTYWFNVRNGITLDYRYEQIAYDDDPGQAFNTPDLTNNDIRGRYTYRFDPATSIFAEYLYQMRDYDDPGVDYDIHSPSVGIQHAFTRTLSGLLQVGYYYAEPDRGDSRDGFTVNANLTLREEYTTYTLFAVGGYREEFQTADNAGFVEYYRGGGTLSHRLMQRLTLNLGADVEWDNYIGPEEATLYTFTGGLAYQAFRWLNIAATVTYTENNSNIEANDYTDWRAMLMVTLSYVP